MWEKSGSSDTINTSKLYLAWFVATLFFFYQYMVRVFPNIMSREIFELFKVTAEEFSSLGGIYSLTYGIVQLPVGFLLDKVNIKKISLGAILLAIAGVILFGSAKDFSMLQLSRLILAVGSGAALGIALKIVSGNFTGISRSFLSGLTLTIGVIGPIAGGKVVSFVLQSHEWRIAVTMIGLAGFILFLGSLLILPSVNYRGSTGTKQTISHFKYAFSPRVISYAIIAGGIYAPVCVFADLWGSRFLSIKFGLTEGEAIDLSLSLYLGLVIGSLTLPYFSEKIRNLSFVILTSVILNAALLCILIFKDEMTMNELQSIILAIGFLCGSEMICFNAAWYLVPKDCSGLTTGVINSLSLILVSLFQQIFGMIMDGVWDGKVNNVGSRIYSEDNYLLAMSSIPVALMICFIIGLVLVRKSRPIGDFS